MRVDAASRVALLDNTGSSSESPIAKVRNCARGSCFAMADRRRPVVTVGTFDGVHLGHRDILRRA